MQCVITGQTRPTLQGTPGVVVKSAVSGQFFNFFNLGLKHRYCCNVNLVDSKHSQNLWTSVQEHILVEGSATKNVY